MSGSVELDQLCEMEHTFVPHFIETELIDLMRTYGAVLDDDDNLSLEITETQRRLSLEPSPADDATAAPRRRLSQRDSVRRQSLRTAARPAQFSLLSDAVPPPQVQQFTLPPRAAQLPLHQQRYIQRLAHHPLTLAHAHPHHRRRRPPSSPGSAHSSSSTLPVLPPSRSGWPRTPTAPSACPMRLVPEHYQNSVSGIRFNLPTHLPSCPAS